MVLIRVVLVISIHVERYTESRSSTAAMLIWNRLYRLIRSVVVLSPLVHELARWGSPFWVGAAFPLSGSFDRNLCRKIYFTDDEIPLKFDEIIIQLLTDTQVFLNFSILLIPKTICYSCPLLSLSFLAYNLYPLKLSKWNAVK